jgi:hypothetical protein
MSMTEQVLVTDDFAVGIVRLNRSERKNALTEAVETMHFKERPLCDGTSSVVAAFLSRKI